jgi:hypothetical protein
MKVVKHLLHSPHTYEHLLFFNHRRIHLHCTNCIPKPIKHIIISSHSTPKIDVGFLISKNYTITVIPSHYSYLHIKMSSALENCSKGSKYHQCSGTDNKPLVHPKNARQGNTDNNRNREDWVTDSDDDSGEILKKPLPLLDPGCKKMVKVSDNMGKGSEYTIQVELFLRPTPPWANIYVNDSSTTPVTTFSLPPLVINGIRAITTESWKRGIKKEFGENGVTMFKRHFRHKGDMPTRVLMRNILAYLASQCWIAQSFPSILNCEDGLTLRKSDKRFPECYWLGVSLRDGEYLEILGATDELLNTIKLTIREMELNRERRRHARRRDLDCDKMIDKEHSIYQFRLKPMNALNGKKIWPQRKLFILRLLERLEERGWCLYTTYYTHDRIIQNKAYYPGLGRAPELKSFDEHATEGTWYFVKSKEWKPENPVKLEWK